MLLPRRNCAVPLTVSRLTPRGFERTDLQSLEFAFQPTSAIWPCWQRETRDWCWAVWNASTCERASSPSWSSMTPKPNVDHDGSPSAAWRIPRSACLSGSSALRGIVSLVAVTVMPARLSTRTVRPVSWKVQIVGPIVQSTRNGMYVCNRSLRTSTEALVPSKDLRAAILYSWCWCILSSKVRDCAIVLGYVLLWRSFV